MKIELDDDYVAWVMEQNGYTSEEEVENYALEVLNNHKLSWDNDED